MVKQASKERRQWLRAKRILSIQHRLIKRGRKKCATRWSLSTTEDMSVGGLAFLTEYEYKKTDMIEIKVIMSGLLDIYSGVAEVVRVEKNKTAVFFLTAVAFAGSKIKAKSSTKKTIRKKTTKKSLKRV
jgi:hypothetical protein